MILYFVRNQCAISNSYVEVKQRGMGNRVYSWCGISPPAPLSSAEQCWPSHYFVRNKWGVIFPFAVLNNYAEVEQTKRNHGLDFTGFYVFSWHADTPAPLCSVVIHGAMLTLKTKISILKWFSILLGTSVQFQTAMSKWSRGVWGIGCIHGVAFHPPLHYHLRSDVDLPSLFC